MAAKVMNIMRSMHHYASHYAQFPELLRYIAMPYQNGDGRIAKSRLSIIIDHLYLFFVLKVMPVNYYLFQFNRKARERFKEYMDEPGAPLLRHKLYRSLWNDRYSSLVNDKYLFHCLCRYHGISVPELYGVCSRGFENGNDPGLSGIMDKEGLEKVILKPVRGVQGRDIYFAFRNGARIKIESAGEERTPADVHDPAGGAFIVQEVVSQHPQLDKINPCCLNTIRIITFLTRDNEVEFLAAMLRTSSGRRRIDNFSSGGIVIAVDIETGRLKGPGFLKARYGKELAVHPHTGTVFESFQVPLWKEVKETAVMAQKIFFELKAIGWDLAVSPQGPVIIEGNIEWGTTGIQATNGGLLTPKNRALFSQYGLTFRG